MLRAKLIYFSELAQLRNKMGNPTIYDISVYIGLENQRREAEKALQDINSKMGKFHGENDFHNTENWGQVTIVDWEEHGHIGGQDTKVAYKNMFGALLHTNISIAFFWVYLSRSSTS